MFKHPPAPQYAVFYMNRYVKLAFESSAMDKGFI